MKKNIRYLVIVLILTGLGIGGYWYWYNSTYYPSTDDAYVHAHHVEVTPQVSGEVIEVSVHDHQPVKKRQLLYQIDPRTFELAVTQARARFDLAQQEVAQLKANEVAAADAVKQAQILYANAAAKAERQARLLQKGFTGQQTAQNAEDAARAAKAAQLVNEARLAAAKARLGQPGEQNHQVQLAKMALELAKIHLRDTQITAACSGHLTRMTLHPGDYVVTGQPNFILVCDNVWWINANYKETALARIHLGQSARVTVDMYGGHVFSGQVVSIGPATGTAFSLLPPENATGNWVKVTQRIPVRVRILGPLPKYPLRVGTSAEVTIDTLSRRTVAIQEALPKR